MKNYFVWKFIFALFILSIPFVVQVSAQSGAITYQGRLNDAGAGNGSYLLKFELFDQAENGALIDTLNDIPAAVVSGVFSVELNFTAPNAFDGNARFLQISVKRANDPTGTAYITLHPRQRITSVPYALRAQAPAPGTDGLNALIKTTTESAGTNCAAGGTKIETGLDANRNGMLDGGEINASQTKYVCNGATPAFYTRSTTTFSVPRNTVDFQRSINCLTGDIAIGGGFSTNNNIKVYRSAPTADSTGWDVLFANPTNTLYGASIYVTCVDLTP